MPLPGDLSGRVVVVTGGASGIGHAIARAFAEAGARVVIGSRTATRRVRCASSDACDLRVTAMDVDVRSAEAVDTFLGATVSRFGTIDILINSAGVCYDEPLSSHAGERWDEVIDVNLNGVYRTMRFCLPRMIARRWGRIINIASDIALLGSADYAAYCASKAAVISLTRSAALEGGPYGVACNTISPGWVATDMARRAMSSAAAAAGCDAEDYEQQLQRSLPRGTFIKPEEIADLAVYLCREQAIGITMQDLGIRS
jgi:NAD(P)-dependent dehydrogenase (short-subunit alcohol dehydrogenase family)